jgi:hypothetical protein
MKEDEGEEGRRKEKMSYAYVTLTLPSQPLSKLHQL